MTTLLAARDTAWNRHDTRLPTMAVLGIVISVVLTSAVKLHPFLARRCGWSPDQRRAFSAGRTTPATTRSR
jgi:hypothetical protein